MQVTATWPSGQSGAPASSHALMAGALKQRDGRLAPGRSSVSLLRTQTAALDKWWKHGLAQVALPGFVLHKSLLRFYWKVKADWYWCCRREVLRIPVENQPLARQCAHSVVSALRWNKCHRYVQKQTWLKSLLPGISSSAPHVRRAVGELSFLISPRFQFRAVSRKGGHSAALLSGRLTCHCTRTCGWSTLTDFWARWS